MDTPDFTPLETAALSWPERARALTITTREHFTAAGELLTGIKGLRKEIAETCDPVIAAAHASHKAACEQKKKLEAPLVEAEKVLKDGMLAFEEAEERRLAQERVQQEERARQIAEDVQLEEAEALEAAGHHEMAERILSLPPVAVPVPQEPTTPKVTGISMRKTYKAEVVDALALVKAVAAGAVPMAALGVNNKVLQAQARSLGPELRWPGVRVVEERSIAAGSR